MFVIHTQNNVNGELSEFMKRFVLSLLCIFILSITLVFSVSAALCTGSVGGLGTASLSEAGGPAMYRTATTTANSVPDMLSVFIYINAYSSTSYSSRNTCDNYSTGGTTQSVSTTSAHMTNGLGSRSYHAITQDALNGLTKTLWLTE